MSFRSASSILTRLAATGLATFSLAGCASLDGGPDVAGPMYFYPERGQSQAVQDRDRYECYRWSLRQAQTGSARPVPPPRVREAMGACMAARGYRIG